MADVPVALIAAVSEDGFIGRNGALPWHVPGDFAFFKKQTMGKPAVMGRKTFESLPGVLPGRTMIVVTRQAAWTPPQGAEAAPSLEQALARAQDIARRDGAGEVMVWGGEEIFRQAMPLAQRIYLTTIHTTVDDGDARFPPIDAALFKKVSEAPRAQGPKDSAAYTVTAFERV